MAVTFKDSSGRGLKCISFAWTSVADPAGTASTVTLEAYNGRVAGLVAVPGADGEQPTDNYDITLTDSRGIDVLAGAGANMSNAAAVHKVAEEALGYVVDSKLTFAVANAGTAKTGVAHVFLDLG